MKIKKEIKIELNKDQKKYLPAIQWLISDRRATGKTYLLAVAFIMKAIENPGRQIQIFDHIPRIRLNYLLDTIQMIVGSDNPDFTISSVTQSVKFSDIFNYAKKEKNKS